MRGNKKKAPQGDYESLYRRYMALTRQVEQLSALREIGLAISGSLDLDETLAAIVNVVQGALDVRRVTIYIPEKEQESFRPVIAKYGDDLIVRDRLDEETFSGRGTPLGEAMATRSVVLCENQGSGTAYVPLIAKNEPLGVLSFEDPRDGVSFSAGDVSFFQQLGSQIAMAIHNAQLYAMAVTDGLTGLYVRRYFDLRMQEEFALARRYGRPVSLLLFDIDHFKRFNDTHGHQVGDMVLRQFATMLQRHTRRSDVCCRYGGEEMTVILPETGLNEAARIAEKFCRLVREHPFQGAGNQTLSVTASIGVAAYCAAYESPDAMVRAADEALYRAKENGRNRVELAGNGWCK